MKAKALLIVVAILATAAYGLSPADAQAPAPISTIVPPPAPQVTPAELDAMLAPIALYPDPLVAQILMASTYPLEVVEADRWLQEPANAGLKGAQLMKALDQQPWDPSVKSLVPFPAILRMMDSNLDWTERVGNAFLADQGAVMDSVQRLRELAMAAGNLASSPQQTVSMNDGAIVIEPVNPAIVYVPVYVPATVYGVWPYPTFPPFYFPEFFGGVIVGGMGFGWVTFATVGPLWGWCRWDWPRHHIDLNPDRFGTLNGHRPPPGNVWQHDPAHRAGVPYRGSVAPGRTGGMAAVPAESDRAMRGYPPRIAAPFHPVNAPGHPPAPAPRFPPTFESFGSGPDARAAANRGRDSRTSMPAYGAPHLSAPRGAIPPGGRR